LSDSLDDWGLAERVAGGVARSGPEGAQPEPLREGPLGDTCAHAAELVRTYSQLEPTRDIPLPEAVDRQEWSRAVIATLRGLAAELEPDAGVEINLPGPLGGMARSVVRAAGGTEVGLAAGYAARRVLGQYDISLTDAEQVPRLLFVAPNLRATATELEVELEPFVRWVALHETTHAIQFASAPWLREHLASLLRAIVIGATQGIGAGDLVRKLARDPRSALNSLLRGELASMLAGPKLAPHLDRVQAAMTLVEGHAEHVMDGAAAGFVPGVEGLRRRIETRRASRGPLETIVSRLLGLDLKLRQYRLGKEFCDAVAERGGIDALNRAWTGVEALPTLQELEDPNAWLPRTAAMPATA